jgi:hypothetical protein
MFHLRSLPLALLALAGSVFAQTKTGLQPVGFMAFSSNDVNKTVEIFRSCPSSQTCELAFLAYSFGTDFNNARTFIQNALPGMTANQKLAIGIYLDDGANRDQYPERCYFRRNVGTTSFWNSVRQNDSRLKDDWQRTVANPAAAFIREMQSWASGRGYGSRLSFVVIPVLEDGGPNGANPAAGDTYRRILSWTQSQMPSGVTYRRSSTARTPDRVLALEFHDDALPSSFQAGDLISQDGVNNGAGISDSAWQRVQANAISRNGSGLWWNVAFNHNRGASRSLAPWQRGTLKPFTNDPALVQRAKTIIATRR